MIKIRDSLRRNDDAGAFAILYAVLLLVLLGLAAIVVDMSSLRSDRRLDRAAADTAALAGATVLGDPADARAACLSAWHYTLANLGLNEPDSAINCAATFPRVGDAGYQACPTTARTASATVALDAENTYVIRVTWPVLNDSALMLHPDVEPVSSPATQPVVADDGNPCDRVAVEISRTRPLVLGPIYGVNSSSTRSHSVAKSALGAGVGDIAAPLVVLDPHSCDALTAEGGGAVLIAPNDSAAPGVPGMIVVDSDGTGGDVACTSNSVTINSNAIASGHDCSPATFTTGQCNSAIWSEDSSNGGGRAHIYSLALRYGVTHSYNPNQVTCATSNPPSGPLCPKPEMMRTPITRWAFIDNKYNCAQQTDCATNDPKNGIGQLKSFVNASFASTGDCLTSTYPSGYSCVSKQRVCTAGVCTTGGGGTNYCTNPGAAYSGNVYVDCPDKAGGGFSVSGQTAFPGLSTGGGTIVFSGDVSVSGCLAFNATAADLPTWCGVTSMTQAVHDGPVVVIQGQLNASSNSSTFVAPQTFIMLGNCNSDGTSCTAPTGVGPQSLNIQSGSAGGILWSAPLGPVGNCAPGSAMQAPSTACFTTVALWSEYHTPSQGSGTDFLTGQSRLLLQGTFFTPNGQFNLSGGNNTDIRSAQFVSKRLDVKGGGLLTMVPDAEHTNPPPLIVGELIR